ncbi:hypothetical protein G7008_03430 [Pseudomonas psychrotolerans]|jgi:hypothetical protein|uniref:hypothetical protein n=1 Tax=Pseudomonas oryzihabitans TaxID=47885 RepID=UPI0015E2F098|nr:hypothetical protein [Pseudomonas psychrotolerans]MBA1179549.1 hypothetical protein [Pseudomonas psychrotolerans]MBA1212152.1 hypothetical protein [Pseudomonas psychrotolerans]
MKQIKSGARWLLTCIALLVFGTGLGYFGRTWECRSGTQTVYVAAPGFESGAMDLPAKLYRLQVSSCTLPAQWGGDKPPLEGYP